MGHDVRAVLWTLIALLTSLAYSQSLPYNPTTILFSRTSSWNQDIAYVFLQNSNTHQLVSLNISSTLSPSNLSLESISPNLPFLSDDTNAFIPSISSAGEISVYTGSCSTSTSSSLWRFTPTNGSSIGNGTWLQDITTTASDVTSASLPGAGLRKCFRNRHICIWGNVSNLCRYIFHVAICSIVFESYAPTSTYGILLLENDLHSRPHL
jgi:hypothetical protein